MRMEWVMENLWMTPSYEDLTLGIEGTPTAVPGAGSSGKQRMAWIDCRNKIACSRAGLHSLIHLAGRLRGLGYFPVLLAWPALLNVFGGTPLGRLVNLASHPYQDLAPDAGVMDLEKAWLWQESLETGP